MKIKTFFSVLLAATVSASAMTSFAAYTVTNQTDHNLNVYDSLGALAETVPPGKSADCKRRCSGPTFLHAIPTNGKMRVLCSWHGIVLKDKNNQFVISNDPSIKYPERGSCSMEYTYS